jgi:HPr kinase/phosphorylase
MSNQIIVEDIIFEDNKYLNLVQLTYDVGHNKSIKSNQIFNFTNFLLNRHFDFSVNNQIVIISKNDIIHLNNFDLDVQTNIFNDFLKSFDVACFIISDDNSVSKHWIDFFNKKKIALLKSVFSFSDTIYKLAIFLSNKLSPNIVMHGVLTEVYGMGILLTGKSGIGKSETALELIERGHRLIADDIVEISLAGSSLIGKGSEHIKYHMEIRGLGIINIKSLYGIGSIKNTTKIDAVIEFEEWDSNKEYDRLGLDDNMQNILGISVPKYLIPVRIGRNLAIIIEVAAKNQRLKQMGTFSAQDFNKKLMGWIQRNEDMLH